MRCEACGYQFLLASSTKCPDCGDLREDIVAEGYDFLTANTVPIMDSVVGLKAANAHLTRQLAAQALVHAEQMEGLKKAHDAWEGVARLYEARVSELEVEVANRLTASEVKALLSMRVTPTTKPTDAQQTASDMKAALEPKAFPAGALKTGGSDPRMMGP